MFQVIFKLITSVGDDLVKSAIQSITEIFSKDPYLVIKAYEMGFDFNIFFNAVRDADPEMALAGIEFWQKFIMIDTVIYREDFKKKLFEQ